MELRPYQKDALDAIDAAEARGVTRQLVVMATGLGKTILVAALLARRGLPRTFGFMHRDELIAQSAEKILAVNPGARIGVEKAESSCDPDIDQVILASVQTVGRREGKRLPRIPRDWPRVCWLDEAHHAPSSSNLTVLDHFGLYGESPDRTRLLIGSTATPDRLDEMGYDRIFDDVVYRYDLREAIKDGWLADVRSWRISADLDLGDVRVSHGEFSEGELAKAIDASRMKEVAADTWEQHSKGRRTLVFCVTKAHAREMSEALGRRGARTAVVVDDTPAPDRKALVSMFRKGELDALVGVGVFVEGFDVPEIETIHVLRPTRSRSLYLQMLGRGTRKTASKSHVEVFDYTGNSSDVLSAGRIFGLPDSWQLEGDSALAEKEELEKVEEMGVETEGAKGLDDLFAQLSKRRLSYVKSAITDTGMPSRLAWLRPSRAEERWVIAWPNAKPGDHRRLDPDQAALHDRLRLWGSRERLEVFRNELGMYEAWLHHSPAMGTRKDIRVASGKSLVKCVGELEARVETMRPHVVKLLDKKAKWGLHPSTDRQHAVLGHKGVPAWVLPQLNKREASILIAMPQAAVKRMFEGMPAPPEGVTHSGTEGA